MLLLHSERLDHVGGDQDVHQLLSLTPIRHPDT